MIAGGFSRVDGTIQFYTRVNALLSKDMVVVDFGSGRGEWFLDDDLSYRKSLRTIKGKVKEVVGIDVDPVVKYNLSVDRSLVFDGNYIPMPDASVDMILADHVFEHLPDPTVTATELNRVLTPGGWICARTPNKFGYVAVANRIVPENLKTSILHFAQPGRKEEDVFPAHYRLNTEAALRKHFQNYDIALYAWDAEPNYHGGMALLFHLMRAWSAVVPTAMSNALMAFMRKSP